MIVISRRADTLTAPARARHRVANIPLGDTTHTLTWGS
jgi:hypothetical protein